MKVFKAYLKSIALLWECKSFSLFGSDIVDNIIVLFYTMHNCSTSCKNNFLYDMFLNQLFTWKTKNALKCLMTYMQRIKDIVLHWSKSIDHSLALFVFQH